MQLVVDGIIYQMQAHGGISRMYSEILPRMCELEPDLNVWLFTTGLSLQNLPQHRLIYQDPPDRISRLLYPSWFWTPVFEKWIDPARKYARHSDADTIWHSTYYTSPQEWHGSQVVTVVDMIQEKFPVMFSDLRNERVRERKRNCIQNADIVICISEATRQDVLSSYGISQEKTKVIYLAHSKVFQKNEIQCKSADPVDAPYILYVGTRDRYKNFGSLLNAFAAWRLHPAYKLVVVGMPWTTSELELISELNLEDRVLLLSKIDDRMLCRLYNHAAVFVYPSLYEGFGLPLLEAMACGCPLVASDIPSTREVAGEIPVYFDPQDDETLVAALDNAVQLDRADGRIRAGLDRAGEFSWQQTARQTLDVYRTLWQM